MRTNKVPLQTLPRRKVVAKRNLPLSLGLWDKCLIYGLYSKVYDFPLAVDVAVLVSFGVLLVIKVGILNSEAPVDIFAEE